MRRVKVIGTARRRVPSRWFELLGSALVQRRRVWLRYFKRSDRSQSEREVSPQRLVHYRATWYLDAWCHASDGLRRFALDAVRDARVAGGEGEERAGARAGGGAGRRLRHLRRRRRQGEVGHAGVQRRRRAVGGQRGVAPAAEGARSSTDGRYELQVPYSDATELTMDILRHGDSVTVTGDKALAAAIAQRLRSAAARYA